MKSIVLCERERNIYNVYPQHIFEELKDYGFDGNIYSKSDIINDADLFQQTEYIFSTWGMPEFTEDEIRSCLPNLKCVFYAAGSVQKFAHQFINCGVKVFSAWAANAVPVAEYTVAQIILANKGFYSTSRIFKSGKYIASRDEVSNYRGNYGVSVGIIGAGMIGKLVIKMLKAYNLKVKVFAPFLPDDIADELNVEKVTLEEIFSTCTVVSNHLANNEQTQNMLNYELFSLMPEHATFLNTGRGAQVVEDDLIKFLEKRPDVTAVLDVTMPEPPLDGSKLYTLENCILTPHIAGSFGDEVHRMAEYMIEEFKNLTENTPCKYEVTKEMLKTMA